MTIHSCRDLAFGPHTTGSLFTMHAMCAFMQGVLGYTFHSQAGNIAFPPAGGNPPMGGHPGFGACTGSNFIFNYYEYDGSSLTVISQSTFPYRSASILIGMGPGRENWIQLSRDVVNLMSAAYPLNWPESSGSWPWPGDPLSETIYDGNVLAGKWLAIKSDEYPLANSGIFRIISSSLSDNAVVIDYRSTSNPFPQTSSYVTASLWFAPEGKFSYPPNVPSPPALNGNGSATGYRGSGSSVDPRIILTSPSPDAWQVRLCIENQVDRNGNSANDAALTAMPGYSGSNGDFPTGSFRTKSQHLHLGQWRNLQVGTTTIAGTPAYQGMTPAFDAFRYGGPRSQRLYMWGDDETGSVYACIRNSLNMNDAFIAFGEAEDPEPVPHPVNKLFVMGSGHILGGINWRCGNYQSDSITGLAYSLDPKLGPISCTVSPYVFLTHIGVSSSIWHDTVADDTPFLNATELVPVDLVAGTWSQLSNTSIVTHPHVLNIEPRRLGRFPIARLGRCVGPNASGSWYATTPNLDWFHVECGVYLPWGGINSLP